MKQIVIKSVGFVTKLGSNEEQLLNWDDVKSQVEGNLEIGQGLNARKVRRMDHISKLILASINSCLTNSQVEGNINYENTGIIANVGYGPINTIIKFAEQICTDEPELASPTIFTNTVFNCVVGHAAIYFGLKGPSTVTMGSNSIFLSMHFLNKNAASNIFTCGVEDYCQPVFEYAEDKYDAKVFSEGVATLLLSNEGQSDYGCIVGSAQKGLGYNPFISDGEDATAVFEELIKKAVKDGGMSLEEIESVYLGTMAQLKLRTFEEKALSNLFSHEIQKIYIKDHLGETLGASTTLSVVTAAVGIKEHKHKNALVIGMEVTGTLEAFVLRSI